MKSSIFSCFILALFVCSSCQKGSWDKEVYDKKDLDKKKCDKDHYDKYKETCFDLVYPVTYIMPDGTAVAGNEEKLESAIKAWYTAHPNSEEKPVLQYPVNIIFEDETTQTVVDEETMIQIKKDC